MENSEDLILKVSHLVKIYQNDVRAVDDISFEVKRGSLFAFLGQNGAGKSTTINIICQILYKNSGEIILDGKDLDTKGEEIKSEVGIVFQNSVLDNSLSARENLSIRAQFYGIHGKKWKEREAKLIEMLELKSFYDRPIGKLSGGQKRRVDIARAMVHDPKLLILDEPTTGLDPQTRKSVWNLVNYLREKTGMTVFLTTHYMEEAEKATYVVIMNKGRIIARGTPTELKNKYSGDYVKIYREQSADFEKKLLDQNHVFEYNLDNNYYQVKVSSTKKAIDFIETYKEDIPDFEVVKGDMDDVFLNAVDKGDEYESKR